MLPLSGNSISQRHAGHLQTCQPLLIVAAALQSRAVCLRDGRRAVGSGHPSATRREISPATREQAMLMQALVLISCEGNRDRQGVGARVRAAHRCFDRAPAVSIAPTLEVGLDEKVDRCLANGCSRRRR